MTRDEVLKDKIKNLKWLACALTRTPILLSNNQQVTVTILNEYEERGFISMGYTAEVIMPNGYQIITTWDRYGENEEFSSYDFKQPVSDFYKTKFLELESIWKRTISKNDLTLDGKTKEEILTKITMTTRF